MGQAWGGDLTGSSGHAMEYMIKHWEGPPGDFRGQKEFPVRDCSECLSSPETPVNLLVHLKLPVSVHVSATFAVSFPLSCCISACGPSEGSQLQYLKCLTLTCHPQSQYFDSFGNACYNSTLSLESRGSKCGGQELDSGQCVSQPLSPLSP